tara:strand:+ start:1232 stop:1609 length:378 start_codon:yes stop_codon:yes gene_type:complete
MLDIKKNVILLSLLLTPLITHAQIGCIDADYSKVESARVERTKDTLIIRVVILPPTEIDVEALHEGNTLQIRIYGTYIMQDHIQINPIVSLLEYTGFTQINVVGGKRVHHVKAEGSNTLKITVGV